MNSHCCPCVFLQPFQGHSQLSTCSDHGIWTFPNPWAQPAPPGKAENQFWSGRNRHPCLRLPAWAVSMHAQVDCTHTSTHSSLGTAQARQPPCLHGSLSSPSQLPSPRPTPAVLAPGWVGRAPHCSHRGRFLWGWGSTPGPSAETQTTLKLLLAQGASSAGGRAVRGRTAQTRLAAAGYQDHSISAAIPPPQLAEHGQRGHH